jgi:hypothetical protein
MSGVREELHTQHVEGGGSGSAGLSPQALLFVGYELTFPQKVPHKRTFLFLEQLILKHQVIHIYTY